MQSVLILASRSMDRNSVEKQSWPTLLKYLAPASVNKPRTAHVTLRVSPANFLDQTPESFLEKSTIASPWDESRVFWLTDTLCEAFLPFQSVSLRRVSQLHQSRMTLRECRQIGASAFRVTLIDRL